VPVRNVSHVAIGVREMERSLPFWTEVVGLRVTLDTVESFTVDGEKIERRAVYLRQREAPDEPGRPGSRSSSSPERGADTITYGEPPGGFVRAMFVRDPDGNVIQFDQRAG